MEVVDLDTKDVIRSFDGHVKAVESLSWSRYGRYLLSASKDWKCVVWDLYYTDQNMPRMKSRASAKRNRRRSVSDQVTAIDHKDYPTSSIRDSVLFDTPLVHADFHPYTSRIILATTSAHEVALVYLPTYNASRRRICWLRDQTRDEARATLLEELKGLTDQEIEDRLKESPASAEDAS